MDLLIIVVALVFLMFVAYRGYSVILFAPVAALGAVLFTDPSLVAPMFSSVFMKKMVGFLADYFPVFMLGSVFGKVIEISGFSKSIVSAVIKLLGRERAMMSIVLVCLVLTYGGVSLFVVVFAVYPFAAEMFRQSNIPKRLIPGTIALGAFTVTMDALPGSTQIQNIIPTTFFNTNSWAAPWLGVIGSVFILAVGMAYLQWVRRKAAAAGEGYGTDLKNEPEPYEAETLPSPWIAVSPLVVVFVMNRVFTDLIPRFYGKTHEFALTAGAKPIVTEVSKATAIWAVEAALILGILTVIALAWKPVTAKFADGTKSAVAGSLLAAMNTASEYGFGGVIAALPGFLLIADTLKTDSQPAHQRSRQHQCAGRHHRIGVRGHEHRAGGDGRYLHRQRQCGRNSARSPAPRGLDGERRHGHAASQRRRDHAAGGGRVDPQAVLQGHLRHHDDQDRGGVLHHRRVLRHRHRVSPADKSATSGSAATPQQEKSRC